MINVVSITATRINLSWFTIVNFPCEVIPRNAAVHELFFKSGIVPIKHCFQSELYKQKGTGNFHDFSSRVYSWCQIDLLELRTESFWWCESKLIARLSSLNRDTWRGLHTLHCSKRQGYTKIKTRTGTGSTMYTRQYRRDKYEDRDKWNVCLVAVKLFKE